MKPRVSKFRVISFDCYGTLIDWETGIWDALQPLLMANQGCDVSRAHMMAAFAEAEHAQQCETPDLFYPDLLARVHGRVAQRFGLVSTPRLDAHFGDSVPHWPAFSDTAGALRALKKRFKLVILSNVDVASFAASNRKLGVAFDGVYTAEEIGSYKPDPANFEFLLRRLKSELGLERTVLLHTAQSLFHDHVPARALGLANAWIDRGRLSESGNWGATAAVAERPEVDFVFSSLAEMVAAIGDARG